MQTKSKYTKMTGGFTLVELLVVIAIIAMLMAVLMPSLKTAKEKARQAVCSTNLHNLFLSWELYTQNNDQKLCPPFTGGEDGGGVKSWVSDGLSNAQGFMGGSDYAIMDGLLWPYVEDLDIYHCPTDKSGRLRSYAMSFAMGGGHGKISLGLGSPNIGLRDGLKPVTKMPKTSGKLVFVDSEPSCSCSNDWIHGSFSPIKANVHEWVRDNHRSDITARHSGGCNYAFADGSCGSWKWVDPETVDFLDKMHSSLAAGGNPDYVKISNAMVQRK
jgi:prepilin-type N-terminal cleavage/methylation domain-containing protein/prepilin-type processing-associated H-X9-DG protein